MRRPIFIKGHLSFTLDKHQLEFIHQNLSIYGVAGLQWAPLSPQHHFGAVVNVNVRIPQSYTGTLHAQATLMRERTTRSDHMVVKFLWDLETKSLVNNLIAQHGFTPAKVTRKYPRIPVDTEIATFPLKVFGRLSSHLAAPDRTPHYDFEVRDLSPQGILLTTNSPRAANLRPADRLDLVIESRGQFTKAILAQGKICRITDEMTPGQPNPMRVFGIQFMTIDAGCRDTFLAVLKSILAEVKVQA